MCDENYHIELITVFLSHYSCNIVSNYHRYLKGISFQSRIPCFCETHCPPSPPPKQAKKQNKTIYTSVYSKI